MSPLIKELALKAGVTIVECEPDWGGRIGYTDKDCPQTTICGFRTESAAYKHWYFSKFGESTGKALLKMMARK